MSDLTRIKLEHRDECFAVENDPDGCTCGPAVLVQIGGKDRGWTPASGALPRGWTVAGYDQLRCATAPGEIRCSGNFRDVRALTP
jgi:hypothetical protein